MRGVPADLERAGALGGRPDGLGGAVEGDGLEAGGVVGPDGAGHHQQLGPVGGVHSQCVVGGDVQRPHVEAELGRRGDPPLLDLQQLVDQLQQLSAVEVGQGQPQRGSFQAQHVALGPEDTYLALRVAVGLEPLEALDAVVQGGAEGVELKVLEGDQCGRGPARLPLPVDGDHVVGVVPPEEQVLGLEFGQHRWGAAQVPGQLAGLRGRGATWKVLPELAREAPAG